MSWCNNISCPPPPGTHIARIVEHCHNNTVQIDILPLNIVGYSGTDGLLHHWKSPGLSSEYATPLMGGGGGGGGCDTCY